MAAPDRTADGRHIVVDGRRWRATDPSIPEVLRKELVGELMAARRAVGLADHDEQTVAARARVHDAKVALGERGRPWWDERDDTADRQRLAAAIRVLLRRRDATSSICPSDAARVVGGEDWRPRMGLAREVAAAMAGDGVVQVTQGSREVDDPTDPATWRGAVRLRRGPRWPTD